MPVGAAFVVRVPLAVVLARGDDLTANETVGMVAEHLPCGTVARWTHSQLFDAAGAQPILAEWARQLRRRHLVGQT